MEFHTRDEMDIIHKIREEGEETLARNTGNQSMLAKDLDASFAKIHERLANYFEEGNELRTRSSTSGAIEIVGCEKNEKLTTLVNPRPSSIFARIIGKKGKKKTFQKWRHQTNSFSQIYKREDTLSSNQLDRLLGPKQLDKNSRFKLPRVSSNSFLMADKLAKSYLPPRLSEISVSEEVAKRIFKSNPPKFTTQKQYPLVLSPSTDNLTPISALRQRVNSGGSSSSIDEENKSTAAIASDFYGLDETCNGDFLEELFLNTSSSSQMMSSSLSSLNESKVNCSLQNEGNTDKQGIGRKYEEDSFWKDIPSSNIMGELMLSKREEFEKDSFGMEGIIEEIISKFPNLPLETFNPKIEHLDEDEQISNEIMKFKMIDTQPSRNESVESSSIKHIEAILDSLIDFVVNPKREAQEERPKSNPKPGGINEFGDAEFSLASCKDEEEEDEIEELSELTLDFPIFTADKPCVNPCFECEIANPNEIENQIISEVDSVEVSLVDFDLEVKDEEEELDQEELGSEIKDLIDDLINDMMNLKNNFNKEDLLDHQSEIKGFENVEFGIQDYNGDVNLEDPELASESSLGHALELKSIEQQSSLAPESGSEGGSLSEEGIEQVDFSFQLDEDEGGCDLWHYEEALEVTNMLRDMKDGPTEEEILSQMEALIESIIEKVIELDDMAKNENPSNELEDVERIPDLSLSEEKEPSDSEPSPRVYPTTSEVEFTSSLIESLIEKVSNKEDISQDEVPEVKSPEFANSSPISIPSPLNEAECKTIPPANIEDSDSERPVVLPRKSSEVCQTAHSPVKESLESSSRVYPSISQMNFTSALIESMIEKVVNMKDISEDEESEVKEPEFATLSPISILSSSNEAECDPIPDPFGSSEISSTPIVELGCNDPEGIQRLSEVMLIECEPGVPSSVQVPEEYRDNHDETPIEPKEECNFLIPPHEIKEEYEHPDQSETIPPAKNIVHLDHSVNLSRKSSEAHSPLNETPESSQRVYPSTSQMNFTSALIESMIEKIVNIENLSEDEDLSTDQPASSIANKSSIFKEELNFNEIHGLEIQMEDSFEDKEEEEIDQVRLRVQIEELINSVFEEAVDSTNKSVHQEVLVVEVNNIEIEPELDQVLFNKDLEELREALGERIKEAEEEEVVELEKDPTEPEPPSFTILKRKAGESESRLKIGKSSKNNRRTKSLEELKSEEDSKETAKKPKKLRMKKHLGRWWKGSGMPTLLGVNPDEIDSEDYYKPIKPKEAKTVQEMEDIESEISIGHSESEEDELTLIQKIGTFTQMDTRTPLSFSTQLLDSHRARKPTIYDFDKVGSSASSVSLNPNDVDMPDFKPLTKRKTISNLPKAIDFEYHKYAESISGSLSGSEIDNEAETGCLKPVVEAFGQNNLNPIWEEEFSDEDEVTPKEKLHDLIKVKDSKFRAFWKSVLRFLQSLLSGIRRICGRKRVESTI